MQKYIFFIITLLICVQGQCDTVIKIEPQTFQDSKFPIMINYQAPWCQQCLDFDSVYEQLSKKVDILLGTFDCSVHLEHCQKIGINKFPTLIFHFDTENFLPYSGSKNDIEIQTFLKTIKELYQQVDNQEQIQSIQGNSKFILYYESTGTQIPTHLQRDSVKINQRNEDEFKFVYKQNCETEKLYLIKNNNDNQVKIEIKINKNQNMNEQQSLVQIIENEAYSGLQQYSLKYDNWGFQDQGQAIFIFYSKNKISSQQIKDLNELSIEFKNKITVTYIIEGQWNGTLLKFQERFGQIPKNSEYICFGVNDYNKYRQIQQGFNIQDVKKYIGQIINHELTTYYKSELPFQIAQKQGDFIQISGSQLLEMINNKEQQPFIIIFVSKFCPLCQRTYKMLENFQKMNNRNSKQGKEKSIDIYKIDGQLNEIPGINIMTYPVVYQWNQQQLDEVINQNYDSREFHKQITPLIKLNIEDEL